MVHQFSIQQTFDFGPFFAEFQDEPFQNDPTSYGLQLMPIFNDRTKLVTLWTNTYINNRGWKTSATSTNLIQPAKCAVHSN
jgi:hypothetical protein